MDANKNKPAADPSEPKAKKPKRERPPETPVVIPPAVWLGLLLVPFLYLLVQYIFRDDPQQQQPEAAPAVQQQQAQEAVAPAPVAAVARGRGGAVAPPEETIPMAKLNACDFDDWVGKPLPRALLKRHLLPYRVILPGSGTGKVPPGGSPLVLNIEVDRQEIVTKVWCG